MTPTRRSLFCWAALMALALLVPVFSWFATAWMIATGFFTGSALVDGYLARKKPDFDFFRSVHHSLPVTAWNRIEILLSNNENKAIKLAVCDRIPANFKYESMPVSLVLAPKSNATIAYKVYPIHRGRYFFSGVDTAVTSPLGLWRKKWFFQLQEEVQVFPNFREIGRYILLALSHQLNQMGIRKIRYRGRGGEFHQLRDYRRGDELSKVDWKATSRMGRLISREFQTERDQQLIFILDCGRRMRHREIGRSFFSQALNAMLLLSHVALRQGDAVGIFTFGGHDKWIPPLKSGDALRQILNHTFDLHATTAAADYVTAASKVMALQHRRALIIFLTNSRGEDHTDIMRGATLLARKHLVVVTDLRESIIDRTLDAPIDTVDSALRYLALEDYLNQRAILKNNLVHTGIQTLDVTAEKLPSALVNRYLGIKTSGRL